MNYDKIINAAYEWISLEKLLWFLLFFWLSMPVFLLVPNFLQQGLFYVEYELIVQVLYYVMYLAILMAFMLLTCSSLKHKKFSTKKVSLTRYVDTIFLVFAELWFILVWNIHRSYRFTQLLLLIGIPILYYYYTFVSSVLIGAALVIFLILYIIVVIYNAIRCSFSVTIFYNKDVSIIEAVKKSWHLTHKKFWKVLVGYVFAIAATLVLFIVVSAVLAAIITLFLVNTYTYAISYKMALMIGSLIAAGPALVSYYFGFIELYAQLNSHHESGARIKRVLAARALMSEKPKRKITKKKSAKKKAKKKNQKRKLRKNQKRKLRKRLKEKIQRKKPKRKVKRRNNYLN